MHYLKFLLFLISCLAVAVPGYGREGYAGHPRAGAFIDELVREHGFDKVRLRQWLSEARRQPRIIELISTPAERTLSWHEYRAIFIKPERIEQGRAFLAQYRDAFERVEAHYQVPREVVAAIIGVETWYGRYLGPHRVLDALATLAFDYPPRSGFFRSELTQYFLLAREQGFAPEALKGSYAGAMGYGQFIPSSYRHYAVDFDQDDRADLVNNPVDAIGSVANYLHRHHWRPGGFVARQLPAGAGVPERLIFGELKPQHRVSDFRTAGVDVPQELADSEAGSIRRVVGGSGEQLWLTGHNFYVITRYNHSHLYALAVWTLAQELAAQADSGVESGNNRHDHSKQ